MSVDECKKLIEQLNAKIPKAEIEKLYAQSDTNHDELDEEDFIGFYYSLLNRRPELDEVFIKYSSSSNKKGKMTAEDLSNFLNNEQKIELPLEVCTFFFKKSRINFNRTFYYFRSVKRLLVPLNLPPTRLF